MNFFNKNVKKKSSRDVGIRFLGNEFQRISNLFFKKKISQYWFKKHIFFKKKEEHMKAVRNFSVFL